MSLTKSQANSQSQSEKDILVAAANARFIAAADAQIQSAIDQGLFEVGCYSIDDIDPKEIYNYYRDLGYSVAIPDVPSNLVFGQNPSNLFGETWQAYWDGIYSFVEAKKPFRFIISWK